MSWNKCINDENNIEYMINKYVREFCIWQIFHAIAIFLNQLITWIQKVNLKKEITHAINIKYKDYIYILN